MHFNGYFFEKIISKYANVRMITCLISHRDCCFWLPRGSLQALFFQEAILIFNKKFSIDGFFLPTIGSILKYLMMVVLISYLKNKPNNFFFLISSV